MTPGTTTSRVSPWYAEGLRFECQRCGDCCRGEPGYVWVTAAEMERIAAYLGEDRSRLEARCVRRIAARRSLRERPNGDCVFFADGCTVYPVRPRQCRTFPFWPENLTGPRRWERLRRECPGIGRGRLWTRREIDLLAGRPRRRQPPADPPLARALAALLAVYSGVDAALAPWAAACSACGRCCRFVAGGHVLYVTELERALLASRCAPADPGEPGRCPYQAGPLCAAREVRPLGCRTFFCRGEAAERGRVCHEEALRRMAPLREAAGLPIRYEPLLGRAKGPKNGHFLP